MAWAEPYVPPVLLNNIAAGKDRPLVVVVGSVALFGFALPRLGLALSLPLLIVLASLAGDEFRWKDVLINCVALTVGSWLIFIVGLKLNIGLWPGN